MACAQTLLHGRAGTVDGVFTAAECGALITAAEPEFVPAAVDLRASRRMSTHPDVCGGEEEEDPGELRPDLRSNERWVLDDAGLADAVFERVGSALPASIGKSKTLAGFAPRVRFYRYRAGAFFRPHSDGGVELGNLSLGYTVLIYLDAVAHGGATLFHRVSILDGKIVSDDDAPPLATVLPAPGRALFFFHKLRHSGAPVLSGTKHVLRLDAMYATDPR